MGSVSGSTHIIDGLQPVFWSTLDWYAEHNPSKPWVVFPSPSNSEQVDSLSMMDFSEASHRIAHILRPGRMGGEDGQVVALLLHCDTIHYNAMIAGTNRAGFVPYPMSGRNTPEAIVNMLEATKCHRIVFSLSLNAVVNSVQSLLSQKNYVLHVQEIPRLDEVLPSLHKEGPREPMECYPHSLTQHKPDDVVMYLHSSGSTGLPKSIPLTQRFMTTWLNGTFARQNRERKLRYGTMALPTFHTMGIITQFISSLAGCEAWAAFAPQYPAPPVIPTPQNTLDAARVTECHGLWSMPSFIDIYSESDEAMKYLKTLKLILFGGGPLSETTGNKLQAAGIHLATCYGGTEWGPLVHLFDDDNKEDRYATKGDWQWVAFPPEAKVNWVPQGDGTYELQFLTCETHQPAVENIMNPRGYSTSDLLIPHPTNPDLWHVIGRTDDVIVLGSGEKIVPLAQEGYLASLPSIQGAVMFGRGKTEAGVLLEPRPEVSFDPKDVTKLAEFRNQVWPHVEEANKSVAAFGRIFKGMIIVTDPNKPLGRTGKGTVLRKHTLDNYADEIEELYQSVQTSKGDNGISPPETWSVEQTTAWLLEHATAINKGIAPSPSVDLFEQGFDSLSATFLRNRIIGALHSSTNAPAAKTASQNIPQDFIFVNPTIEKLSQAIIRLIEPAASDSNAVEVDEVTSMVDKYSSDLPAATTSHSTNVRNGIVVLLTGSTGGLGSHLLATLVADPRVRRVYTFDRGSDIKRRLQASFLDRGLAQDALSDTKITMLSANSELPGIGLQPATLEEIKSSVTHIIHNAWKVDFNLSVGSFESNVRGTRHLLDFSASCAHAVRFIFCSSVSTVSGWDVHANGFVPEVVPETPEYADLNGYAKSKYVAERILSTAAAKGLSVTILRIGQIAGSRAAGAWNSSDWVPNIVKSSLALKCFPDLPGDVSWFSVDTLYHTVLDILNSNQDLPEVMNIVHPRPRTWRGVMLDVIQALGSSEADLPLVSFDKWTSLVETRSVNATERDMENIPAIKLLQFIQQIAASSAQKRSVREVDAEGMPKYDTSKAQRVSPSLRDATPLSAEEIGMWVKYWKSKGFLTF